MVVVMVMVVIVMVVMVVVMVVMVMVMVVMVMVMVVMVMVVVMAVRIARAHVSDGAVGLKECDAGCYTPSRKTLRGVSGVRVSGVYVMSVTLTRDIRYVHM